MTDFERQLQGQLFREFARHWRNEILDRAEAAARAAQPSRKKTPVAWLDCLWPLPLAWGLLAVIWILLAAIDGAGRSQSAPMAHVGSKKNNTLFALQTPTAIDRLVAIR